MAALAETNAKIATKMVVTIPTAVISNSGNTLTTLSAKPMVYSAMERACAR